ncbi:MAG: AAA family ATPase [Planctomycetes bacterium]|nr:AAA family ATPase [Planctomycetota bacterium]
MAAPILDAITIEGFKSIASIRDLPMRRMNVLIGANGSGKSNFLDVVQAAAQEIGLPKIRRECPTFDRWLGELEQRGNRRRSDLQRGAPSQDTSRAYRS